MKKILIGSSIALSLILTGCGSTNPNLPSQEADVKKFDINVPYSGETIFDNVENSETLIKVSHKLKGKHTSVYKIVVPAINKLNEEVKKRGYEYYQIVSPKQISNLEGFPINNKADLAGFLNPAYTMPRHTLNFLETKKTLMDNQNSQNVVDVPFLIFGTTEFNFVVRLVKEPSYDDIVWNVNN